jgi:hypothetical protein
VSQRAMCETNSGMEASLHDGSLHANGAEKQARLVERVDPTDRVQMFAKPCTS